MSHSYFSDAAGHDFHRDVVEALAATAGVEITLISVDGVAIAFTYSYVVAQRLYLHRIAYDPTYARFSPGMTATLVTLETAADTGIQYVEFGGGDNAYKLLLSNSCPSLTHVLGAPRGWRGRATLWATDARLRLHRYAPLRALQKRAAPPDRSRLPVCSP